MKVVHLLIGAAAFVAILPMASPVNAANDTANHEARISELEATVKRLEALLEQQYSELDQSCARVEDVEKTLASCASVEQVEEALANPADHPTLYDETEIKVGGYVKMDALVSDYSNAPTRGVGDDFFIPSTIQTSGESGDPRLNLHAKETRFWLKSFTPTERGDITTHFEIDFQTGEQGNERVSNSFSPRVRHATLSWDGWTVGQTWSNFFNVSALPDYLDFIGPVGVTFIRQAQIRYTRPAGNGDWAISLENPETTLTPYGGGSRIDADDSSFPDVVVRRNWSGDWGNFSVAALARELKIDQQGIDNAEIGGGVLILAGVYGRHVSVLLLPIMLGALMVHLPNGWVFSAPKGGWEYPAFLIVASIAHALAGDGALALRSGPLAFWRREAQGQVRMA